MLFVWAPDPHPPGCARLRLHTGYGFVPRQAVIPAAVLGACTGNSWLSCVNFHTPAAGTKPFGRGAQKRVSKYISPTENKPEAQAQR
jgi:hypothetical protein